MLPEDDKLSYTGITKIRLQQWQERKRAFSKLQYVGQRRRGQQYPNTERVQAMHLGFNSNNREKQKFFM